MFHDEMLVQDEDATLPLSLPPDGMEPATGDYGGAGGAAEPP